MHENNRVGKGAVQFQCSRTRPALLEQTFLHVETKAFHLVVVVSIAVGIGNTLFGKLVYLPVGIQYVVQRFAPVLGFGDQQVVGQTSSTLKRFENSTSCHKLDLDSPGELICSRSEAGLRFLR